MIYVATAENHSWIKIGHHKTSDCWKRIAELQCGNPHMIILQFAVEGTLKQEQAIHALLIDAVSLEGTPQPPNEWYPGKSTVVKLFINWLRAYGATTATAMLIEWVSNRSATATHSAQAGWSRPKSLLVTGKVGLVGSIENIKSVRDAEVFLREAGLSKSSACALVARIKRLTNSSKGENDE